MAELQSRGIDTLDLVIANAGIILSPAEDLKDISVEDWTQTMKINVRSVNTARRYSNGDGAESSRRHWAPCFSSKLHLIS